MTQILKTPCRHISIGAQKRFVNSNLALEKKMLRNCRVIKQLSKAPAQIGLMN